jgi:DNA-binding NtrC family response regulator
VLYVGKDSVADEFCLSGREPIEVLAAQGALLIRTALLLNELRLDNQRLSELESLRCGGLIGGSPAMQDVFRRIERVAPLDAPVLITGEQSTGKELAAREIHRRSARAGGAFRILRSRRAPESALMGELSAQLDANQDGTLFVEDIEQLPPTLQDMLIRYLQRADGHTERMAVVRLIASSKRDLAAEVATGGISEELFTRLVPLAIHLPPLRERDGDLFLVARYLLDRAAREACSPARGFSREAIAAMKRYSWPGNMHELESRIRQAVVSTADVLVGPDDLGLQPSKLPPIRSLQEVRAEVEREYTRQVIDLCNGNHTQAAQTLGIARSTLYRYLGELGEPDDENR